jgi:hypothetical protein
VSDKLLIWDHVFPEPLWPPENSGRLGLDAPQFVAVYILGWVAPHTSKGFDKHVITFSDTYVFSNI